MKKKPLLELCGEFMSLFQILCMLNLRQLGSSSNNKKVVLTDGDFKTLA